MSKKPPPEHRHLSLAITNETRKALPTSMRSHFGIQPDGSSLVPMPMPPMHVIKERAKELFLLMGTTPGLVNRPLTREEKLQLTPFEIATYNLWLQATEEECPFEVVRYVNDMVIGPPTQKSESTIVKGSPQDWREILAHNRPDIDIEMEEARAIEAARRNKNDDVIDAVVVPEESKQEAPQ